MSTPDKAPERTDPVPTEGASLLDPRGTPVPAGLSDRDGVLRDSPFGTAPPFGGETPFFVGGSEDVFVDDTEGIPTGLPSLADLPELDTEDPSILPGDLPEEQTTPMLDERPLQPVMQARAPSEPNRFGIGFAVASLLWGTGIALWRWFA